MRRKLLFSSPSSHPNDIRQLGSWLPAYFV